MKEIDDILDEMRKHAGPKQLPHYRRLITGFVYRLEPLIRQLEADRDNWRKQALDEDARANATAEKSSIVGNAAKMLEALEVIRRDLWDLMGSSSESLRESLACKINATIRAALAAPARNCDVMSLESAKKLWFAKEIMPRLNGDLPLGKEIPFEEWFVSQLEQGAKGEAT